MGPQSQCAINIKVQWLASEAVYLRLSCSRESNLVATMMTEFRLVLTVEFYILPVPLSTNVIPLGCTIL